MKKNYNKHYTESKPPSLSRVTTLLKLKCITFLHFLHMYAVLCIVTQSCPILCNPMGYSPPGSSVHGDSPGKNTGVGCYALLQGIFPAQGSNPGLLHYRWILYQLNLQGSS